VRRQPRPLPVRKQLEQALERLLAAVEVCIADLDALDGDPDLEDPGDSEPDADREPSLGSLEAAQFIEVTERAESGRALHTKLSDPQDQTRWTFGGSSDIEDQCEDEGGACEDEGFDCDGEPDDLSGPCPWPDEGDQTMRPVVRC
jgi:hypothetical protein